MHYNPFHYIRSEKDILKLVNTIIANTKGEGEKSTEDFWVKAERLLYSALIGYIWYEAPEEEQNFSTLLEFINASETREDDEEFKKAQMDIQRQYQGLDMQYKSQVKNTMDKVLAEVSTEKELSAVVPKTLVRSNGMQVQKQEFVVQGGIDITDDVIQKLQ